MDESASQVIAESAPPEDVQVLLNQLIAKNRALQKQLDERSSTEQATPKPKPTPATTDATKAAADDESDDEGEDDARRCAEGSDGIVAGDGDMAVRINGRGIWMGKRRLILLTNKRILQMSTCY